MILLSLHSRASDGCRGVWKSRGGPINRARLLSSGSSTVSGLVSTPALTWLSPGNTCSDASESSPCVGASGKKVAEETGDQECAVLCGSKHLPQQLEATQSGTEANFKMRFFFLLGNCEYQDLETSNP